MEAEKVTRTLQFRILFSVLNSEELFEDKENTEGRSFFWRRNFLFLAFIYVISDFIQKLA